MTDETILSGTEAEAIRTAAPARRRNAKTFAALLRGDVIHIRGARVPFNSHRLRNVHGLRLRSRTDGNGGHYFWTEPVE